MTEHLWESVLSFHLVGPGDLTQIFGFDDKTFTVSHPTALACFLFVLFYLVLFSPGWPQIHNLPASDSWSQDGGHTQCYAQLMSNIFKPFFMLAPGQVLLLAPARVILSAQDKPPCLRSHRVFL